MVQNQGARAGVKTHPFLSVYPVVKIFRKAYPVH